MRSPGSARSPAVTSTATASPSHWTPARVTPTRAIPRRSSSAETQPSESHRPPRRAGTMETRRRRNARRVGRSVSGAALVALATIAALALVPALFGLQRYVIVSGSMTGTYDRGSLVLDEVVPVSQLRV